MPFPTKAKRLDSKWLFIDFFSLTPFTTPFHGLTTMGKKLFEDMIGTTNAFNSLVKS